MTASVGHKLSFHDPSKWRIFERLCKKTRRKIAFLLTHATRLFLSFFLFFPLLRKRVLMAVRILAEQGHKTNVACAGTFRKSRADRETDLHEQVDKQKCFQRPWNSWKRFKNIKNTFKTTLRRTDRPTDQPKSEL